MCKLCSISASLVLVLAAVALRDGPVRAVASVQKAPPIVHSGQQLPSSAPQDAITDIVWQWTGLTETASASVSVVPDPARYTISFAPDGSLSILADCNVVGGSYTVDGANIAIMLGPSTLAFCGEESLDQQYLMLLGQVTEFGLDGDQLVLIVSDGAGQMAFGNAGEQPLGQVPIEQITGIVWQWSGLAETQPASLSVVTDPASYSIVFHTDGTLSIRADCNVVGGSYAADEANLTITLGPSTLAFCGEQSLDQQYLGLLDQVAGFGLDGEQLILVLKDGAGRMTFSNAGPALAP
jgi:heat shock protein HslJ